MNIVDVIKSQLTGDVLDTLSSLIGESKDRTRSAAGVAIPGLLSVLANLASTGGGSDKLINALKQVDPGSHGSFGEVLSDQSGSVMEKGGSLLNILLGAGTLPAIISILSKFTGIPAGSVKSLLSYLAPLILASIAKQFANKSLTAQALSNFFAEQKSNISSALPQGFSLADIPGLTSTTTASRPVAAPAPLASSGLPGWLLPLVGLVLLGALAWYFLGGQPAQVKVPAQAPEVVKTVDEKALFDSTKVGTDLTRIYASLTDLLSGVKDVPTAEAAVPKLTDLNPKIDDLRSRWDELPDAAKPTVAKVTTDHLGKLKELISKVLAIPGVGDKLKPILDAIVDKLAGFAVR